MNQTFDPRSVLRGAAALGGRSVCNARLPVWARGASWNFAMLPIFSNLETQGAIEGHRLW